MCLRWKMMAYFPHDSVAGFSLARTIKPEDQNKYITNKLSESPRMKSADELGLLYLRQRVVHDG